MLHLSKLERNELLPLSSWEAIFTIKGGCARCSVLVESSKFCSKPAQLEGKLELTVEITEKTNLHLVASIQGPPDPRRLLWPIHSIAVRLWGRLYSQSADVCIALGNSSVLWVPPLFLQKLKNWPSTQGAVFCSASKFD